MCGKFSAWSVYFFCNELLVMQEFAGIVSRSFHSLIIMFVVVVKENDIFETAFSILEVNLHYTIYRISTQG